MRILSFKSFKPLLLLTALMVLGLAACDTNAPQHVEWGAGNDLDIAGPTSAENDVQTYDGFAPGVAYFYVRGHNRNWTYSWNVNPAIPSQVLQEGQFFRIDYEEPDTFVVTVQTTIEGQDYDDTVRVAITAPIVLGQIGRLPQFSTLNTAIGGAGISIPDSNVTILAPTNDAFTARFGGEIPADSVLADILETHVIPQTLTAEEITSGASFQTFGGGTVTFEGSGETLQVVLRNQKGETIAKVPATAPRLPVTAGTLIKLDGVLVPVSASVAFLEILP